MPRPKRVDLAGIPQHVVQRGVDRRPCFVHGIHYREYLRYLLEESARSDCRVHGYVLMCNHVHLLVTPAAEGGVGRLMQGLGRRYVGFFNQTMDRSGTLWDGRFKSCMIDSETYLLRCYRYIELNPVRAGTCAHPGGHQWTSFHRNGMGLADPLITPHAVYLSLGATDEARTAAYRAIVAEGCHEDELETIRAMTSRHRAVGGEVFKKCLQDSCGRPMGFAKMGRPVRTSRFTEAK